MPEARTCTIKQAAKIAGVSEKSMRQVIAGGHVFARKLHADKERSKLLVSLASLMAWLDGGGQA